MWGIALLLGVAGSADPVRIGAVCLFISRPRPVANLLAFLLGGMATGLGSGVLALILLPDFFPVFVRHVAAGFTGGPTKVGIGVLALSMAAVQAVGLARQRAGVPMADNDPSRSTPQPNVPSPVSRLRARARHVLAGGSPWVAFVAGLLQLPVPVEYLAALSIITASGAAIDTQFCAAVAFTIGMFAIIEIPLVVYLVKPERTEAIVLSVCNWLRPHGKGILVVIGGAVGIWMVASGVGSI
jgi:Sap, sulfolipid-1-addressing protein